jgi:hypothetical protein
LADNYPPTRQREALLKLVEALGCWDRALRRDDCGGWAVFGKLGHIHAVPRMTVHGLPPGDGFQIYFRGAPEFDEPTTTKAWTYAKQALKFCRVTQDGDWEGCLFLDRLPSREEAETIRDKLGIRKRVEYGEETLARKREAALMARKNLPQKTRPDDPPGSG